ncbi:MAG: M20 family metallopeptidase, partial [Clostridiaceae bacterium]|nr:M20 family metallopeptidase [Clostridiaceae bacterium]
MQDIKDCVQTVDKDYIIRLRRELHMRPEVGFDLPNTIALVKRELDSMNITYTEKYGRSSVVAEINGDYKGFTIGIRADMDALPITETNDIPYKSMIPGKMHACGHDAHTAMLLGTAKVLKSVEKKLDCRIKLLFQPCEEGEDSGAKYMVEDGVMDDIDIIIGLHVENWLESGHIGVCPGVSMAASRPVTIEFFGKTAHATLPQSGHDALAMAVKAYNDIQIMLAREIDPFARYVCSVGSLHAGTAHNIIADHAVMQISIRTYDTSLDKFIFNKICKLSHQAADFFGGTAKIESDLKAYPIVND